MNIKCITLEQLYQFVSERLRTQEPENMRISTGIGTLKEKEQILKMEATDGSTEAREYMKNSILFMLGAMKKEINNENIDSIISQYYIDYFANILASGNPEFLKSPVDAEIGMYFNRYSISPEDTFDVKLSKLSQIVYQELFGFSILDELVFDGCFNEVVANRFDYIWIQYKGIKRRIPNHSYRFISEDYYNKVIENRLISSAREEMNAGEPFVNCTLKNGFRVTAIRPPLSKHRAASIRCFENPEVQNKAHTKFMEEKMLKLVEILVEKGRRNIAIIGEQSSGKTTAADELIIRNLSKDLSIGLAEYTDELSISEKYPEKNVVELHYGKQFEPSSIMSNKNLPIFKKGQVMHIAQQYDAAARLS